MNDANLLQQLRDIHLPAKISIWPSAPGWIILCLVLLGISCLIAYIFYRRRQKLYWRRIALQKLYMLRASWQQNTHSLRICAELAQLLRQAAFARFSRRQIAGLHGLAWLQFLDQSGQTNAFTQGPGRLLLTAPYQRQSPDNINPLFELVESWLKNKVSHSHV